MHHLSINYFLMFYQLGNGLYTGMAPVWSYDFKADNYTVPDYPSGKFTWQ